ncbi:MAG: hypothetical protein AB7T06_01295 [Kofleriaceae bacterium]
MQHSSTATIALATLLASCEVGPYRQPLPPPPPPDPRLVQANMEEHADVANELHRAILDGRLHAARDRAQRFVWYDRAWATEGPQSDELIAAADTIYRARDLVTAAGGMARLAYACGACHERRGVRIDDSSIPPEELPGLSGQMVRHGWAAQRLWDALVIPSDRAWREGVSAIGNTAIDLARTTNAKPNERVVELAEHLDDIAMHAGSIDDHARRATVYGEMMVTCARCHSIVRPGHTTSR